MLSLCPSNERRCAIAITEEGQGQAVSRCFADFILNYFTHLQSDDIHNRDLQCLFLIQQRVKAL